MMVTISFTDFKRICDEYRKRIYYYYSEDIVELYFISEGVFVKSFVNLNEIENKDVFFSDKLFTGAIKLLFNIPSGSDTSTSVSDNAPSILKDIMGEDIIKESKTVEKDNPDIQQDGVDGEPR